MYVHMYKTDHNLFINVFRYIKDDSKRKKKPVEIESKAVV